MSADKYIFIADVKFFVESFNGNSPTEARQCFIIYAENIKEAMNYVYDYVGMDEILDVRIIAGTQDTNLFSFPVEKLDEMIDYMNKDWTE